MKIIEKDILPFQEKNFFMPIRDKLTYARTIIFASRKLLLDIDTSATKSNSSMKLIVDRMSRLFFYKDNKYFSISFPFNVQVENNLIIEISGSNGTSINSQSLSSALLILNDDNFQSNPSLLDYFIESNNFEAMGGAVLEEIFQSEPSYLRYDNDPAHENGTLHPLHHLDINYSSYGTYKLGLPSIIVDSLFEDILNINTDCSYITSK